MENTSLSKYSVSFGLSLAITSVVNGLLVVLKEEIPGVMSGMKSITGHHWITHSLFVILLFLLLGFGLAQTSGNSEGAETAQSPRGKVMGGVLVGALIIMGFYLIIG